MLKVNVMCLVSCVMRHVSHVTCQLEDLDMLARLKLAREMEEDTMESLVDTEESLEEQDDTEEETLSR